MLGWLPEREYLFSLVSRNHAYWGYRAAADTVGVFFGTRKERALGPACSDVEYLVARTEGCLGSPIEIFQNHTLFRFYRLFMKPSEVKNLLAPSSTTAESQLKYPMALWNGLFTARHPLKACIECMEADLADLGMPYWRLSHQYPGVWICLAHKRILQRTSVKTSSQLRFNLHCPDADALEPPFVATDKTVLFSFARLIENLTDTKQEGVAAIAEFRLRFLAHLEAQGLLNSSKRLKAFDRSDVQQLCADFLHATNLLQELPECRSFPVSAVHAYYSLASYINGKSKIYPVLQLAIILWFRTLPFWCEADEAKWILRSL
nr:TniQ family protein [Duganella radicis]